MEYASDEPEINILYMLIMKIEELNLRGDKNRTNFTVVLNEKNEMPETTYRLRQTVRGDKVVAVVVSN